ncbi:AI-2E family transporter [Pseudomonas sp. NCCP-436]|uniref:AI-2E family transporter n=1 Tax=Pseudomonas sp. NCCP-436 TaxID=2842481 RepID=UPI001C8203D4|nr:AI-2E family transporter [Pseudomonas sp. NCCP-436]GIZ11260.1 AI-2E family transporter [Pseudomonas sp. NCCP-436]
MPNPTFKNKAFILLLLLVTVAFFWILLPFYGAIFWAVVLAVLFNPLQDRLIRRTGGRGNLSALLTLTICLLVAILPVIFITSAVVAEGSALYQRLESGELNIGEYVTRFVAMLPPSAQQQLENIGLHDLEGLQKKISSLAMTGSQLLATQVFAIGQGTFEFFVGFFVMLYLLFFLLRDGRPLIRSIRDTIPLEDSTKHRLQIKFTRVVRATVKGNLVVAVVQGALGGLIFWLLDIPSPLLWGVLMAFLSLLPAAGAGIVWAPVAAYLMLSGSLWQGLILTAFGVLVIGMVDNILRPILVGKDTRMPDYLILISTLGGLALLGLNGFVIGPLIAALFIACWNLLDPRPETRLPG